LINSINEKGGTFFNFKFFFKKFEIENRGLGPLYFQNFWKNFENENK